MRAMDALFAHGQPLTRAGEVVLLSSVVLGFGTSTTAAGTLGLAHSATARARVTSPLPPTGCVLPPPVARMVTVDQILSPRSVGLQRDRSGMVTTCTASGPVVPVPTGGAPHLAGQVILVSLSQEWLYAYQDGRLVLASPVSSGQPNLRTPTGAFTIHQKIADTMFTSPWPVGSPYYYAPLHVNYGLLFLDGGFYIHDAPWRSTYGPGSENPHVVASGTTETGSHGCVEMPTATAAQLYAWAQLGTMVIIRA